MASAKNGQLSRESLGHLKLTPRGLTDEQVLQQRAQFGSNNIAHEKVHPWWIIVSETARDPMILLLFFAATIFLVLRDYAEAMGLFAASIPLIFMDVYLHRRTQASMEGLRDHLTALVRVRRGGEELEIRSTDIVPGDIVLVKSGELIPADGVLTKVASLQIDESLLTGESLPVSKVIGALDGSLLQDNSCVFAGCRVLRGEGELRITSTGKYTRYGICSDKTGTLTLGELKLVQTQTHQGLEEKRLILLALIASDKTGEDPVDVALRNFYSDINDVVPSRLQVFPFTEDRKKETALIKEARGGTLCAVKGAPEVIMQASTLTSQEITFWREKVGEWSASGQKVLACAYQYFPEDSVAKEPVQGFTFAGLIAFADPVRIAMGRRGSQAARDVASIVLSDDNFLTLVSAIQEAQQLFQNLRQSFRYLLEIHIPLVLSAAVIPLLGFPILFKPIHLVWLELILHPSSLFAFQKIVTAEDLKNAKPQAQFFSFKEVAVMIIEGCAGRFGRDWCCLILANNRQVSAS